jgi:hypothetical protein
MPAGFCRHRYAVTVQLDSLHPGVTFASEGRTALCPIPIAEVNMNLPALNVPAQRPTVFFQH